MLWPSARSRNIGLDGRGRYDSPHDGGLLGLLRATAGGGTVSGRQKLHTAACGPASPIAALQARRATVVGASRDWISGISGGRCRRSDLVLDRIARGIRTDYSRGVRPSARHKRKESEDAEQGAAADQPRELRLREHQRFRCLNPSLKRKRRGVFAYASGSDKQVISRPAQRRGLRP